MTTVAWILLVVAIILLVLAVGFFVFSRSLNNDLNTVISEREQFRRERDDADHDAEVWRQRYWQLENGLVNEAHDMEYIRESLRRAADGDPTT